MTDWRRDFKKTWKPLLQTNRKWDEEKIVNELGDLVFIFSQVSKVYDHLTGGVLSKPMTYADFVIDYHNDEVSKAYDEGLKEGRKEISGASLDNKIDKIAQENCWSEQFKRWLKERIKEE